MTGSPAAALSESSRGFDPRVFLLAIGTFATGTDTFVIAGILPELSRSLSVTIEAAGAVVSVYALVYGIGTPLLALVVGRWRQDRVALAALIAFIVVNLLCAVAPSYAFLIVMRAAAALCAAAYAPAAYVMAAASARPEKRGSALAAVALGSSGSTVAGVPLGTFIGNHFGWPATFVMIAVITAIALIALFAGGPRTADIPPPLPLAERVAPLARLRVWIALAPVLLMFCGIYALYTYIAPLLETRFAASDVPLFLMCYGAGGIVGSQFGGKLVDRFGATRPLLVLLSVFALLNALLAIALHSWLTAGLVMFGLTLCSWACFAPIQTRIVAVEPEHANVMFALINAAIFFGGAVGAALGGAVLSVSSVTALPYTAAILAALAVAMIAQSGNLRR
ncbi:MAG TPA: MFS transporter [Stellaceae bacterium]|jgi:predicted MFS family arabinose efflux permease